ncbi:MAG: energy-coupling factor transporter transmembrane protein EcfT [Clostridia bacterium]|nr:energy-coupling factor transporter transmembrane protein EcfT [Clostridia bacterium]
MLKDITLGQYFPGNSLIHRLDPRTKILCIILYITVIFCVKNFWGYGVLAAFTAICIISSKIPFGYVIKGVKPILIFVIFTALFNLFLTNGRVLWSWGFLKITYEGVRLAAFMVLRLFFLVLGTSLLTLTTSPIALTDGIEKLLSPFKKIGVPAHELAMMMTIALRFVPTLLEETEKIIKAQTARGADFESGNIINRAKAMIPILIPLFVSAFRRADDLAVAMECRCYRGGENRTRLKELKMTTADIWGWLFVTVLAVLVFTSNILL